MRLFDLFENEYNDLLVIYPGRFHPFHIGHGKVFKYLKQNYKGAQVFIASSGKTDAHKSPFEFNEKKKMMMLAGVDPNAVVQTKVPYVASEITDRFDPDRTVVVYAVSEKDMAEDPRFRFPENGPKLKKDGTPAHVQKWTGIENAKPLREHSYIVTVPTFTFEIQGKPVKSATEIRNMIAKADDEKLMAILQDLYQRQDIPHDVVEIFKKKLGSHTMNENWEEDSLFELLLEADLHRKILAERKLTGGEKRSKEAHFKKLDKHAKSDFVDRYGDEAESIMHAVATKRAKNESIENFNSEDPMNPEVAVSGYGVLTLQSLERMVERDLEQLLTMAKRGNFTNVEYLLKNSPLNAKVEAINTAYDELEQRRKRGGKNARGITKFESVNEDEEETKGFDPRTVNALKKLKVKYPHADNVMAALVSDVEKGQEISAKNDAEHDISIADLEKKVDELMRSLEQLKGSNQ